MPVLGRLFYLQIIKNKEYAILSEKNRIETHFLQPSRGIIVDRHHRELAVNKKSFHLFYYSDRTSYAEKTLDSLERLLHLDIKISELVHKIKKNGPYVRVLIRAGLSWSQMAQVRIHLIDLPGLIISEEEDRYYPYGYDFYHVIGYVGYVDSDDLRGEDYLYNYNFRIGKQGIEKYLEKDLRGEFGHQNVEVNAFGRVIRTLKKKDSQMGRDVRLSLDQRFQSHTVWSLDKHKGAVVVLDIHTGEILVMASSPSFNPNVFLEGIDNNQWMQLKFNQFSPLLNKPISGAYPPGSIFKMIVALAALEKGIMNYQDTFFCTGSYKVSKNSNARQFRCWKKGGHKHVNLLKGLTESCDVYFYEIAQRLGIDAIGEMAHRFGFGERHTIGLEGQRLGLIPNQAWKQAVYGDIWFPGDTILAAIGQGYVLATPLQLAVMTARLANGYQAVKPTLFYQEKPPVFEPLNVHEEDLNFVQRAMYNVVNSKKGTAYHEKNISMAGKTGTSQVVALEENKIATEDVHWKKADHALFVGYAPFENPKYAISVVIEHGGGGGKVAAPIARNIMEYILRLGDVS